MDLVAKIAITATSIWKIQIQVSLKIFDNPLEAAMVLGTKNFNVSYETIFSVYKLLYSSVSLASV